MRFRYVALVALCALALMAAGPKNRVYGQGSGRTQTNDATPLQRLDVMRSRLEALRRTLNSAIAAINAGDTGANPASPATEASARLRGLEREASAILSDVNDYRGKQERAERFDVGELDKLETAISDLDTRAQAGLRATAGERRAPGDTASGASTGIKQKKKGGFFSRILGRGGNDSKYDELIGTIAVGRDRVLFEEAATQARKNSYETARALLNVIITAYPESPYLPLAKLAIADTFYLEGTSSALLQAGVAYRDWLTFFPTDPLADDVMLKMAEAEMRQMGLPDRDVSHARKAEQQLKVLVQQFPNTNLRGEVDIRLNEVQESLGMHNLRVANFYYDRYSQGKAPNPKGAQSRLREIVEKYPNFSYMDEVLYRLGVTYVQEEEPDEAAKYFQQLARNHPNSEFAEKAGEQLEAIGVAVPAPDPKKASEPPPVRPGFTEKLWREVVGTTPVTVNKNGVLINKDGEGGDLIEAAIRNGGQLPATTPNAPVQRRAPARLLAPPQPTKTGGATTGVTVRPTPAGKPPDGTNPAAPGTAPATTTTTPPSGTKP